MRTVAGFAEEDASFLTALISGRTSTDQRANSLGSREAIPMVAKHNQQFGCKQWSSARQRVEDRSIGMLPEKPFDISNFLILALNKIEKGLSQVDSLITMGQRDDGVRFEGRATETSKQLAMTIRTQQVGQDKSVAVVVAGATGSISSSTATDDTGSNEVDTVVT